MASRASKASGTELSRIMTSPLATTAVVVNDSSRSALLIPNRFDTAKKTEKKSYQY